MKIEIYLMLVVIAIILISSPTLFPEPTPDERIAEYVSDGYIDEQKLEELGYIQNTSIDAITVGKIDDFVQGKILAEKEQAMIDAEANTKKLAQELSQNFHTKPFAWVIEHHRLIMSVLFALVCLVFIFSIFRRMMSFNR